jgi:hypothetical protein
LEIKSRTGKLSPDQQRVADFMRNADHTFEVVSDIETAIEILKRWSAVRDQRAVTIHFGTTRQLIGTQ